MQNGTNHYTKNLQQMENRFKSFMKSKYPHIDVDRAISLVEQNVAEIRRGISESNRPGSSDSEREIRLPLDSDLNKNLFIKALSEYMQAEFSLGDIVTIDLYENEKFEVVGIRKDELELRGDWSAMNNVVGNSWYSKSKCKKS